MKHNFKFDPRLRLKVPNLQKEWHEYSAEDKADFLFYWEKIKGTIPDLIRTIETEINNKQAELNDENDFMKSCQLNDEIADLASIINDLQILFRN